MTYLIDTHVIIWWLIEPDRLSRRVEDLLVSADGGIHVSAVSAWEITYKHQQGKLVFEESFIDAFDDSIAGLGWSPLPLTNSHAITGARLSGPHKDPFHRMLAGQALCNSMTLVSADPAFRSFGLTPAW
jgi:PIN domain nuclease of toxin-antitoxin system